MHPLFNLAFMTFGLSLVFALGLLCWFLRRPSNREAADRVILGRGATADGAGLELAGLVALCLFAMALLAWGGSHQV